MMSVKWLEQKSGTQDTPGCATDVPTIFYDFCDLLMNRPMTTWKTFVLYDKKQHVVHGVIVCASVQDTAYHFT